MCRNNIEKKNESYKYVLFLNEEENKKLKALSSILDKNDFDVLKYCVCLVYWWSRGEIEP